MMKKFTKTEGLPGGPNEVRVSGFYDQDRFTLSGSYGNQGDVFSTNINKRFVVGNNVLSNDINANLQTAILKGLTEAADADVSFNKDKPVRFHTGGSPHSHPHREKYMSGAKGPTWWQRNINPHSDEAKQAVLDQQIQDAHNFAAMDINSYIDEGYGTVHHATGTPGQYEVPITNIAELARQFPNTWNTYDKLKGINRDVRLVHDPERFLRHAQRLERSKKIVDAHDIGKLGAGMYTGRADAYSSYVGAVPVRMKDGVGYKYVESGKTGGYDMFGRERANVVNFPATADVLYDMSELRKKGITADGVEGIQFFDEVDVKEERPDYLPENPTQDQRANVNYIIREFNLDPENPEHRKAAWESVVNNTPVAVNEGVFDILTGTYSGGSKVLSVDGANEIADKRIEATGAPVFKPWDGKTHSSKEIGWGDYLRDWVTNPGVMGKSLFTGNDVYSHTGGLPLHEFENDMTRSGRLDDWRRHGGYRNPFEITDYFNPFRSASRLSHSIIDNMAGYEIKGGKNDGKYVAPGESTGRIINDGISTLLNTANLVTFGGGSLLGNTLKYEASGATNAALNFFKGTGKTGLINQGLSRSGDLAKMVYHGGKVLTFGDMATDLYAGIQDKDGDGTFSAGEIADYSTNAINFINPFKSSAANYFLGDLAKHGKDYYKGTVAGIKALDSDSDTQTQDLVKSVSYFGSTYKPFKYYSKLTGKYGKKQIGSAINEGKKFAEGLFDFDKTTPGTPGQPAPGLLTAPDPDEMDPPIIAEETGISSENKANAKTTSLRFGGITNGPIQQINDQKRLMKAIVDSPRYIETLKKEFPNYSIEQILEERTNRLNSL